MFLLSTTYNLEYKKLNEIVAVVRRQDSLDDNVYFDLFTQQKYQNLSDTYWIPYKNDIFIDERDMIYIFKLIQNYDLAIGSHFLKISKHKAIKLCNNIIQKINNNSLDKIVNINYSDLYLAKVYLKGHLIDDNVIVYDLGNSVMNLQTKEKYCFSNDNYSGKKYVIRDELISLDSHLSAVKSKQKIIT